VCLHCRPTCMSCLTDSGWLCCAGPTLTGLGSGCKSLPEQRRSAQIREIVFKWPQISCGTADAACRSPQVISLSYFCGLGQWRIQRGEAPSLLTGCILKQVKILHEIALFLPKIFKNFMGRGHIQPSPRPTPCPSAPLFQISGSAAGLGSVSWSAVS